MILGLILICFGILSYTKPNLAAGLVLAFSPSYLIRYEYQGIPTTFLELLLLVFLFITFVKFLGIKSFRTEALERIKNLKKLNYLAIAFVAAGIISTLVSPDKHAAVGILKAFIIEPVLFFYACTFAFRKLSDLKVPLNLLFISACLLSLFSISQYFTFWNLPLQFWGTGMEVERVTSVFPHPNAFALYLAPLISLYTALLISAEKSLNRKNLILGLTVMFIALLLTFSRGAWLAVAFTTFVLLIQRFSWRKVVIPGVIAGIVLLLLPPIRDRLQLLANDSSSTAHTQLLEAGLNKIESNPILGNGLFGFRTTLAEQNFQGEILNYPHNIILNFWLEMGLLGLLSFFGIIIVSLMTYKKGANMYRFGASAYVLTMLVHGLVDSPYFKNDLSVLFWFVVSVFFVI